MVLCWVWELRGEIWMFLETVGKAEEFAQLKDPDWVCDLAFGVDLMGHLYDLNLKLQRKNVFVTELYSHV